MQLSVIKDNLELAVLLLDNITSMYNVVPRSVTSAQRDEALTIHSASLATERAAYLDNWTNDLTSLQIPNYQHHTTPFKTSSEPAPPPPARESSAMQLRFDTPQ